MSSQDQPAEPAPPAAIATARTPGFDVARALAVLGMVIVNYRSMVEPNEEDAGWLAWFADRFEGRAAALFVVLAGVGISLRSRRARSNPEMHARFERVALLKRAMVLLVAGFLNIHLWEWDILHCYAVFLAFAALLLTAPSWVLWFAAAGSIGGQVWLVGTYAYEAEIDFWSGHGLLSDLFFNGLHPVFPWMAFLLIGMRLGRLDLREGSLRLRVLVFSLLAMVAGELLDSFALRSPESFVLGEHGVSWLSGWPRPPGPVYVLAASGTAVAVVCLCISATQERATSSWVVPLTATGQLAFTLYIAHAVAIVIPAQHGLLEGASLEMALSCALVFFAAAVAASVWWRRRFPYGPLEGLIRQITSRTGPAPWGGELARGSDG